MLIRAHEKGWMDVDRTFKNVWGNRSGTVFKKPSFLVYDSFRGHFSENLNKVMRELKMAIAVIPGGLALVLQALDICLNKPFKANVRKYWAE